MHRLPGPGLDVAARRRPVLEGGVEQQVGCDVTLGQGGFADDTALAGPLVAVPSRRTATRRSRKLAGHRNGCRGIAVQGTFALAGKVQGRRTTVDAARPAPAAALPEGGVRLATSWVEPAYLEPDASWCVPGGEPASRSRTVARSAARWRRPHRSSRALADGSVARCGSVFSREDMVRFGFGRRSPRCGARRDAVVGGAVARPPTRTVRPLYGGSSRSLSPRTPGGPPGVRPGPRSSRAVCVLQEAALVAAASTQPRSPPACGCGVPRQRGDGPGRGRASRRAQSASTPERGVVTDVEVRVAAGDPLDEVGAAFVLHRRHTHGARLGVDAKGSRSTRTAARFTTSRFASSGSSVPRDVPPIRVVLVDDPRPACPGLRRGIRRRRSGGWNALTRPRGPPVDTRPSKSLRR